MGDQVKLVEINDDTLVFERAFVARDENGQLVPRCYFSGIACELGTKQSTLELGFVACWPLDSSLQENWPLSVTLEHDNNGDQYLDTRAEATGNPQAVAAVRTFLDLIENNQAQPGQLLNP